MHSLIPLYMHSTTRVPLVAYTNALYTTMRNGDSRVLRRESSVDDLDLKALKRS